MTAATFNNCLPAARIRTDDEALVRYGRDRTTSFVADPCVVLLPETTDEVVRIVEAANRDRVGLVPSGGRTGLSGGAVAGTGQAVVSLERMNRVLEISAADRLVTCQAGVITQVLQATAEQAGLFYPVDFASSGSSFIGGNIATNAGGIRVIRYGMTRDWVAGLKVVTGTGDVLDLNHGLVKNNTGYDLRHLFIGSEGTLGFVVEATMRLARPPEAQRVLVLAVPRLDDLMRVLETFQSAVDLSAFEFFSELALGRVLAHGRGQRPFATPSPFYALLEFDASADDKAVTAFEACIAANVATDGVLSQSDAQMQSLWALRENISESLAQEKPYKNDIAVRISDVPDFLREVDTLVKSRYPDVEVAWYGHIGDGNLHLNILKPAALSEPEFVDRCHHISPELFALVQARNGSISAEHGVGLLKRDFLGYSRAPEEIAAMRAMKTLFDPNGILNPGKLL
ncbi:MAG: FAD-binding oxidoreductase [Pseudomonadales bacterium]|nr:FAD-binding oxidoreductase [Pseudomonadales bacterium]MCP5183400.1 FAD-binding oxidoreductase [Pseudomonadales bacterium]